MRILVWMVPLESRRVDLARPLDECGHGVGQALATLRVAPTSFHPQTILIDEPQNFLHRGAIRKLSTILKDQGKHQFIISTQSPIAITACSPVTIIMTQFDSTTGKSRVQQIEPDGPENLKLFLSEIGASLSGLFGADSVLWVEGQTEAACFPFVLKFLGRILPSEIQIAPIVNTGDFDECNAKRLIQMYNRLSPGPPVAVERVEATLTDLRADAMYNCQGLEQERGARARSTGPM